MQTYVVRRRGIAATAVELHAALSRLRAFEDDEPRPLPARWIRSYALREADGRFGLACLFEADGVGALREHARLTGVAAQEILPVVATVQLQRLPATGLYLVRRRSGLSSAAALARGAALSQCAADAASPVHWLRSYAVAEDDGTLGTVCIYRADDAQALIEHTAAAGLPAGEIAPLIGPVFFQDEPRERPVSAAPAPRPTAAPPRPDERDAPCGISPAGHLALAFVIVAALVHGLDQTVFGAPRSDAIASAPRALERSAACHPFVRHDVLAAPRRASAC